MSHVYKRVGWTTTPERIYEAAKAKAQSCVDDPSPKLTTLERAFHKVLRGQWG